MLIQSLNVILRPPEIERIGAYNEPLYATVKLWRGSKP